MDNQRRNSDRADPLHQVPQGPARGTPQVLRTPLCRCTSASYGANQKGQRGYRGDNRCEEHGLTLDVRTRRAEPIEIEPDAWCDWCGNPLPEPEERHWRTKYCSRQCKDARDYDAVKNRKGIGQRVWRNCEWCGSRFVSSQPHAKCCSLKCTTSKGTAKKKKPPLPARACEFCGTVIQAPRHDTKYCSKSCNAKAYRRRKAKGYL